MSETKQSLKYIFTVTVCNIYMTDPGRDQFVLIYRMWRSVVCGSDGKLYGSDCLLMEAACLNQTNIHVQPLNRCQGLFTQLANCNSCNGRHFCSIGKLMLPKCTAECKKSHGSTNSGIINLDPVHLATNSNTVTQPTGTKMATENAVVARFVFTARCTSA